MSPRPSNRAPADDRAAPSRGAAPALALAALLALAAPAAAQQPDGGPAAAGREQVVDRVVAVVGDTAITRSEVQEQVFRMRQQGMQLPQDPLARDSVLRSVVDQLVEETMLLEQAKRMGVSVPEQQVEQLANDRFSRRRSQFGSDEELRKAVESTGQNMFQFRQSIRSQAWADLTLNRLRQRLVDQNRLPPASVSEREIRDFFEQNAAGQRRPGNITVDRVMVAPRPDSAAADSARALAEKALEEIESGTAFTVAVRRYSDDTGTREDGGDLGWVRRSDLVPSFGDAAWAAPPGRPVGPVESRLGYHVVRVDNVRGGERRVRHILVRPRITDEDLEEAREKARALADSLRQGADADRLAREHGLSGEDVRFESVRLDEISSRLGEAYAQALDSPSEGEVIGPLEVEGSYDIPLFTVLEVLSFTPTGEYRLEDVRDRIRERLMQQKQFDRYVEQLRNEMYVRLLI
jgi:peptidyl-prolyl cis-trans isomerase SurA